VLNKMKASRQEMPIEIEAQSLEQVDEAVAAHADVILVDNLPIEDVREAVRRIGGRAKVELSGGVTLDRIPELARTGADYVSVGALTHSAPAADLSFELEVDSAGKGSSFTSASAALAAASGVVASITATMRSTRCGNARSSMTSCWRHGSELEMSLLVSLVMTKCAAK